MQRSDDFEVGWLSGSHKVVSGNEVGRYNAEGET